MIQGLTYDELNVLAGMKRSVPYERYFGEMSIPEEGKRRRTEFAESLEEEFLLALSMMFTMQQFGNVDWETIRRNVGNAYRRVLSQYVEESDYLLQHIENFSYDIIDSSQRHREDPYYYSPDRARFMAENEANTVFNYNDYTEAAQRGKTRKRWIAIQDEVTRPTHRDVDYTEMPIDGIFQVGTSLMLYPKDASLGASPGEIINCRCSVLYI